MYTNHHTLKYFCCQLDLQGRQGRWVELMQEFHMEILYHMGLDNVIMDELSSRMMYNMSFIVFEKSLFQEVKEAQKANSYAPKARLKLKSLSQVAPNSEGSTPSTSFLQ